MFDPAAYVAGTSFRLLEPAAPRGSDRLFVLGRDSGPPARVLQLPDADLDLFNVALPPGESSRGEALHAMSVSPRMSTIAIGALLNACVEAMPADHAFVNVGVGNGFTFLSGIAGNPAKRCIGVDDFSEFGGPRDAFMERFQGVRGERHEFHDMDYRRYFAEVHEGPIGVYLYDGHHGYRHQLQGLQAAEQHLADGCLVLVDHTNWGGPRRGTLDFLAQAGREHELLVDETTAGNQHPTFWNGIMAFRVGRRAGAPSTGPATAYDPPPPRGHQRSWLDDAGPCPLETYTGPYADAAPLVSLIVRNAGADPALLQATIESVRAKGWTKLEVVVADESGDPRVGTTLAAFGGRGLVCGAGEGGRSPVEAAIERSSGSFVAFVEAGTSLGRGSIQMALGFPRRSQFFQPAPDESRWGSVDLAVAIGDDLAAVVPPGASFVWAGGNLPVTLRSRRVHPLVETDDTGAVPRPLDVPAAIKRIDELHLEGALHGAFARTTLLTDYPGLERELRRKHHCILENERVVVFDLSS